MRNIGKLVSQGEFSEGLPIIRSKVLLTEVLFCCPAPTSFTVSLLTTLQEFLSEPHSSTGGPPSVTVARSTCSITALLSKAVAFCLSLPPSSCSPLLGYNLRGKGMMAVCYSDMPSAQYTQQAGKRCERSGGHH